ncbi:ParB N-terminal domain-containing protein [Microbacterium rhizosphaerae]|uniref:ParB N-terminal domain-containing protein n=1 Tax=Microbacterium rhizosphaerae TaxID=1678237 RepID=A0ABZ0SPQ0_9MICO|nr:ParB N-terminal domain-containing protein [Microbacterium rhizosphaerae]WPR91304.1 ParB N-terminal domain-containing protein [Microbacterium rhizosphaerae]
MKQQGHIELERSIDSIRVGSRHRADLGDIDALAESIDRQGLLQPITVTPEGVLVCGARRLAALRQLGVRKINVWVRAGVSDRLTQLLAEQDENALHKPLSPTEAAALYRECKSLLAEDAARRQHSSRFGETAETDGPNGAVTLTAPLKRNDGDTRTQAALLVTGRRSFTTLERIGRLQDIAEDDGIPLAIRERAQAELDAVENGAPVLPAFRRISGVQILSELDGIANSSDQPAVDRAAAADAAARIRNGDEPAWGEEPRQFVIKSLSRAKADSSQTGTAGNRPSAELKRFVFTWDDLDCWWEKYDPSVIASGLTNDEWQRFERTLEGTAAFADRVRDLRGVDSADARRAG